MKIRVFQSGKGDCLLLTSSDGRHILVDGGHVDPRKRLDHYSPNVAPFLGNLRDDGERLDLVCVSHIDQDHIGGVLRLLDDHFAWRVFDFQTDQGLDIDEPENSRPPEIDEIWHNAFHEQVSKNRRAIADAIAAAAPESLALGLDAVAHGGNFFDGLATSMKEAAQLSRRIGSSQLGIPLNDTFDGKLVQTRPNQQPISIGNFTVSVVGPTGKQLIRLRKKWNKWLRSEAGRRQVRAIRRAAEVDEELLGNGLLSEFLAQDLGPAIGSRSSVTEQNVASIVMYVEEGNQNILLTGDARDDDIVEQLIEAGIADQDGHVHLNVLKVQHHGSENNFSKDFAKKVTADHYIFCGNGEHENPDHRVVEHVIDSRIGGSSSLSPNSQAANQFKLWFSSDESSENADSGHMEELERMVRTREGQSNGQLKFRFSGNRSFSFIP